MWKGHSTNVHFDKAVFGLLFLFYTTKKGGNIGGAYIVEEPENDAKNMLEKIKNEDY